MLRRERPYGLRYPHPEPPVELWGPFVGCTFDLELGTLVEGVVDGGPKCEN